MKDPLGQLQQLADRGVRWGRHSGQLLAKGPGSIPAAVLLLFGKGSESQSDLEGLDLLLLERAATLREHPGQVAFPGGRIDEDDVNATAAALREANEETALDPQGVRVLGELSALPLPVTDYAVTPVLGWWENPSPVHPVDPGESARVFKVPVSHLVAPENRVSARMARGGRIVTGPAFQVGSSVIWGFTGIVLADLFGELGWARPWDEDRVIDVLP